MSTCRRIDGENLIRGHPLLRLTRDRAGAAETFGETTAAMLPSSLCQLTSTDYECQAIRPCGAT